MKFNIDLFDQILILAISHDIAKFELLDEARAVVEDEHQCSLLFNANVKYTIFMSAEHQHTYELISLRLPS